MKVSVLIPVYNCEKYIGEAIESVLAQTYKDFEIIVVNDGSEDKSGSIAASYPSVRVFNRSHEGIPKTRNFALSKAEGGVIAFLDADDLWLPEKLELQAEYLKEHKECGIIFCRYRNFTEIPAERLTEGQKILLNKEIENCLTAACVRKSLFERFGDFNPLCAYGEDTEWLARLAMGGIDLSQRLEEFLYLRRVHEGNITTAHNRTDNKAFYASLAGSIRSRLKKEKNGI